MKKLICLLSVLALLLCGCGGKESPEAPVSGQKEPAETTQPAPAETEPTVPDGRPVSLGRIEGNEYINEYVGYGCKLSDDWMFYSAQELQELPGNIAELLEGTEVGDTMEQYTQISDMVAENVTDLLTMNVQYTKLGMKERIAYALLTEEQILEQVLSQKDSMISSYAQAGIDVSAMEMVKVTFLGEERSALHTTATIENVSYYILQVFDYNLGQYSVVTTFGSYIEDNTRSMLELFYPVA